jgi:ankyrin repeat protein
MLLLSYGADVEAPDSRGCTPVYKTCEFGHVKCLKLLAEKNADLRAVNKNGNSPALIASQRGHDACLEYLIERGVKGDDLHSPNRDEGTPTLYACQNGWVACLEVLIRNGECARDTRVRRAVVQPMPCRAPAHGLISDASVVRTSKRAHALLAPDRTTYTYHVLSARGRLLSWRVRDCARDAHAHVTDTRWRLGVCARRRRRERGAQEERRVARPPRVH